MQNWKLTLAAALLTLNLSVPSLAAPEEQPTDAATPQVTETAERDQPGLVAAPTARQPRPEPETFDNRNDFPDYRARPGVPGAPVPSLQLDLDDMTVRQR